MPTPKEASDEYKQQITDIALALTKAAIKDRNADGYEYSGIAEPGSATSAASWRIMRFNMLNNPVVVQWADGNSDEDNVWDNRASLSYS